MSATRGRDGQGGVGLSRSFSQLLYPMLVEQPSATADVIAQLALAPLEKSAESSRLRAELLASSGGEVVECAHSIAAAFEDGGRLLACGNGGSATSAADIVAGLMSPPPGAPALPALCLTNDIAVVTAIGNDVSYDDVFSRQLMALARPEDVVLVVSTSGNSENLVRVIAHAHSQAMHTVAICGYDGGRIAREAPVDHCFVVRSSSVHRIQEVQSTLYHLLVELVQRRVTEKRRCA